MRQSSNGHGLAMVGLVLTAVGVAACDSATEPPAAEVRVEAITATALTGTVGTDVQPAPSVRVTDEQDRPLAGVAITFKVAVGSGTIPAGTVTSGTDGLAAVAKWTLGGAAGSQTLTAGAGGRADVEFTAMAGAGPLAQLTPVSGNNQLERVGHWLTQPLVVRAADSFGNPVAGVPVTFTVIGGSGSLEGGPVVTDAEGLAASWEWTLGAEAGVQQVSAASGAAQVAFRAFAVAPPGVPQGQIAFTSYADPYLDIAIVNADGSGFTRLTRPGREFGPAWSPDGNLLTFYSDHEEGISIYRMTADGTAVTRMGEGLFDLEPAWSPDGSAIAYSTRSNGSSQQIVVLHTAFGTGGTEGVISMLVDDLGHDGQPAWSPDGRQLAFVSDRAGYGSVFDIYTVNADGSGQTQRTNGLGFGPGRTRYYLHPTWSPDGSMIAYVYGDVIPGDDVLLQVAVMSADGVVLKDLASAGVIAWNEVLNPGSLTWSPDGRGLAYTFAGCDPATPGECSLRSVKYVSLDGSRQGTIVPNAGSPTWRR